MSSQQNLIQLLEWEYFYRTFIMKVGDCDEFPHPRFQIPSNTLTKSTEFYNYSRFKLALRQLCNLLIEGNISLNILIFSFKTQILALARNCGGLH